MASPIIDSAVASPATVAPGGSFVVTILAHDPDSSSYVLAGSVTDAGGHVTPVNVTMAVSDPITFALTGPTGFTITQRAGQPGVFDCKAP